MILGMQTLSILWHQGMYEGPISQSGGSEWEMIKILSKERTRPMPQIHNQGFPHEFAKVCQMVRSGQPEGPKRRTREGGS
jgi:hypothetical protein